MPWPWCISTRYFPAAADAGQGLTRQDLGDLHTRRTVPRALLTARPETRTGVGGYNTIFIFQVLPSGTDGDLRFDCSAVQTVASLKTDIAAKRAAGQPSC